MAWFIVLPFSWVGYRGITRAMGPLSPTNLSLSEAAAELPL